MPRSDFHQRVRVASHRAGATSVILTRCVIQWGVLYWNGCRRSLFHVFSPLICEECAGRWHYKVLQMLNQQAQFPTTAALSGVTRRSAIAGTFLQSLICLYFLLTLLAIIICTSRNRYEHLRTVGILDDKKDDKCDLTLSIWWYK